MEEGNVAGAAGSGWDAKGYAAGWADAPAPPRSRAMAVAALVSSVTVVGSIVGLGLGLAVLITRRAGAWIALAAVVLSTGVLWGTAHLVNSGAVSRWLAAWAAQEQRDSETHLRDSSGTIATMGDLYWYQLKVGDCFSAAGLAGHRSDSVDNVTAAPCDQLHQYEVIGRLDLFDGAIPPDTDLKTAAHELCTTSIPAYIGGRGADLEVSTLVPTGDVWSSGGRAILCVAGRGVDGSMTTGSIHNIG